MQCPYQSVQLLVVCNPQNQCSSCSIWRYQAVKLSSFFSFTELTSRPDADSVGDVYVTCRWPWEDSELATASRVQGSCEEATWAHKFELVQYSRFSCSNSQTISFFRLQYHTSFDTNFSHWHFWELEHFSLSRYVTDKVTPSLPYQQ